MDKNETVVIALQPTDRLKLYGQITAQMERLDYNPCDYSGLKLGFELSATWPVDEKCQPTLAELIVVAVKLNMRIIIIDLNLEPRDQTSEKTENNGGAGTEL